MRQIYSYRGGPTMVAWALHRLAGLGIILFLGLHIVDIFLMGAGRETFNALLFIYKAPLFRLAELALLFGVLYHALNGLRVILMDFVPSTARYQVRLWYIQMVIFLVVFIPLAILMLVPIANGLMGQ